MAFQVAILGLTVLPLAAGIVAFVMTRCAAVLGIAIPLVLLLLAVVLAGIVSTEGPRRYEVGGWGAPLGIDLYADGLSVLMLVITALVGLVVAVYASKYFTCTEHDRVHRHTRDMFWPLSLFLMASLNALFLSGDIFNLYVTLELLTMSAVALIGLAGTVEALAAALRYLLMAVIASLFYLLGVALLYSVYGTVDLELLGPRFQSDLASRCAIVLISVGLLLKTALFPLHFWLPAAHANAPAPASALLSGLVLKAPFFVLLRLWFGVFPYADLQMAGHLLGVLGAAAILWGSVQAIRQPRLKLMIAYSTVAQIGYLFLVFSLASERSDVWNAWSGTAYFAFSHACAKAAAFMAAGCLRYATGSDEIADLAGTAQQQPVTIFAFALAGVGLMGLPPSGAFLAKWLLLNSAMTSGRWDFACVVLVGGLLSAIYIFRVVAKSFGATERQAAQRVPLLMQWTPLVLALLSIALGIVALQPMALLEVGAPFPPPPSGGTP